MNTTDELRRVPFHMALTRPDILFGCERRLVLVVGLVCILLIVVVTTKLAVILGILTWIFSVAALRLMAKSDPLLSSVYQRHIVYRRYYPACSTPFAPSAPHPKGRGR